MSILMNIIYSLGITAISLMSALLACLTRGNLLLKKEGHAKKMLILTFVLGLIGGIIFSLLIVWL